MINEENQVAQQLFIDLESLLPERSKTINPSISTDTSASQRLIIPQKDRSPASNQQASHPHSSPPQMSSPFQIPLPVQRYEHEDPSSTENSPSRPDTLKRGSGSLGPNYQRIKRRRFIKPFEPSQEEYETRDIIEMARANRHSVFPSTIEAQGRDTRRPNSTVPTNVPYRRTVI